eukprot:4792767-Prymnesium_polylepis.1
MYEQCVNVQTQALCPMPRAMFTHGNISQRETDRLAALVPNPGLLRPGRQPSELFVAVRCNALMRL